MKVGDKVKITLKEDQTLHMKEEVIEGILMPSDNNSYFIKLDSGYNLGISKRNVKSITSLGQVKTERIKVKQVKQKKGLPKISILHTGGTIASKVDYKTGAVKAQFKPEELIEMFPEIKEIANINSRLIGNIMSENMNFNHYNLLAKEIEKEIKKGVKGVIITHGTDTLHYTSAALSFMLKGISIPVILVGAQRSSDRGSSDAAINLISACVYISNTNDTGVRICMHKNTDDDINVIIKGVKSRKMHSSRRDAFKSINELPIAEIDYKNKKIKIIKQPKKLIEKLKLKLFKDVKIGLIKVRPGMCSKEFENCKEYDGLIIEGTGLGHAPIEGTLENEKILEVLKKLSKTMIIVMSTQTIYGRVNMNVYSTGRILQNMGILGSNLDMMPETAYIKLAWLLSNYSTEESKRLYKENIVGEISERSENIFI